MFGLRLQSRGADASGFSMTNRLNRGRGRPGSDYAGGGPGLIDQPRRAHIPRFHGPYLIGPLGTAK